MSRWKILSHRLRDERCRDCGRYETTSAPDGCTRCALQLMREAGHGIVVDPVRLFEDLGNELWRQVTRDLRAGAIRADRFYVYVGHDDGGGLDLPMEGTRERWAFAGGSIAHGAALSLTQRYPAVWVVTTVGSWHAAPTDATGES